MLENRNQKKNKRFRKPMGLINKLSYYTHPISNKQSVIIRRHKWEIK